MGEALALGILLALLAPAGAAGQEAVDIARTLDVMGAKSERAAIPGAHRTAFGTQIHPSCFELSGRGRLVVMAHWEGVVARGVERMLGCVARYPEIRHWANEWITQARRLVVTCMDRSSSETGAAAEATEIGAGAWFGGARTEGISIGALDFQARLYEPLVVFPRDFLTYDPGFFEYVFVHEVFHYTSLSNTGLDHDRILRIAYDGSSPCGQNALDDRVKALSSLCSGYEYPNGYGPMAEALAGRMSRCGPERGCTRLWTAESALTNAILTGSRPLDQQSASRLCDRIADEAYCRRALRESGQVITLSHPRFLGALRKIEARARELRPRSINSIPLDALEAFPGVLAGLRALGSTPCFRKNLRWGEDGGLYWTAGASRAAAFDHKDRDALTNAFVAVQNSARLIASNLLIGRSRSCDNQDGKAVRALLANLAEGFQEAGRHSAGLANGDREPFMRRRDLLAGLLGRDLLAEYTEALRLAHYKSSDFDCAEAGLSPRGLVRTTAEIDQAIRALERGAVSSCVGPR